MDPNKRPEDMERITTPELANAFIDEQMDAIRAQIGDKKVLLALSGGVDSSVVAALLIKAIGKQLICVHEVRVQLVLEHVNHLLALALAHEAVVHVHADELLADGLDQERRHHGRVHAAGQRQQRLLVADLGADGLHLLVDERVRQLRRGDSLHVLGALVGIHAASSSFSVMFWGDYT